ncbi:multidrug and toxin extrusion protein 1-like [Synchiropus splendidus]|uniref:multidrug and toxin extrusion protein 1-like n=1 Tax=Synchiropus splendidus TaxID=270530 RepID=UPI00237D72F1|nr:multidrug and toxin extrusion protein 1-like [Synchiropus splendidus]
MQHVSDRLFCCSWLRRKIPLSHRDELYHILRMTGPVLVSRILQYMLPFVVTVFCGRLGNNVMAAYGLATAFVNITTISTGTGLGLACDTLVSQTFGGKNLLRVGVILQRGIIILLLFWLPCIALMVNSESILLCLAQDPEVARIAQIYSLAYIPAVPAIFVYQLQVSYLQNQGIILPQMYIAVVANIANVVTHYILITWLDLGVGGSAAANSLSQIYLCVFLFVFIWWKKIHVNTWGGWSRDSLQEWGAFMKLAVPSTLMRSLEWWVYEIGGFFAGMLGGDELAAQHVTIMLAYIVYMFPFAVQAAACARVGNALGAGDTERAILTSKMTFGLSFSFTLVEGVILFATKSVIAYIFISDENIVSLVAYLMNVYAVLQVFDGLVCISLGVFMGTGKQKIPAVANFVGYYIIGLTLCVTLTFVIKMGIIGFWLGLFCAATLQSIFYIVVIVKFDWTKMTEEAVKRAQKTSVAPLLAKDGAADQEGAQFSDGLMLKTNGEAAKQNGHVASAKKRDNLSLSQLIIRRGLVTLAAFAVLAAGLCVYFIVPLPEPVGWLSNSTADLTNSTLDWSNTTTTAALLSYTT